MPLMPAAETTLLPPPGEDQEGPVEEPVSEAEEPAVLAEVVVEELSIDGMCGVY